MKLSQRANGYWYISFGHNNTKSTGTKNQAEARRIFNAVKVEHLKKEVFQIKAENAPTISQYKKEYIELRHKAGKAKKTIIADERALEYFIKSTNDKMLSEIIISDIDNFVVFCKDSNSNIQNTSINSYLRHIRTFLNDAYAHNLIKKQVPVKLLREPKRLPRVLTDDEQKNIIKYANDKYPGMASIIIFTLNTGARLGDIDKADYNDIIDGPAGKDIRFIGKGNKERKVPLSSTALSALPSPLPSKGKIFTRSYDNITKTFKKIAKGCNINDVHFHNLRATAATYAALSGMTPWRMMYIFGWENISTALYYINIAKSTSENEMENIYLKFNEACN